MSLLYHENMKLCNLWLLHTFDVSLKFLHVIHNIHGSRPPEKSTYLRIILLIPQRKHILWLLNEFF